MHLSRPSGGLAAVLALAWVAAGCSPLEMRTEGEQQIERNRAILDRLPTLPGAQRVGVRSDPISPEGGSGQPTSLGTATTAVYRGPRGATADRVADFYAARLRGAWRCRRKQLALVGPNGRASRRYRGNGPILLACTRGPALVVVDTAGLFFASPRFDVAVDATGAGRDPSAEQ